MTCQWHVRAAPRPARRRGVPPPAPRRSSLRTAQKWQSQMRLPFSHLCSVTPPFQIEPASLGFDLDTVSDLDSFRHAKRRRPLVGRLLYCLYLFQLSAPVTVTFFNSVSAGIRKLLYWTLSSLISISLTKSCIEPETEPPETGTVFSPSCQ